MIKRSRNLPIITNDPDYLAKYILDNSLLSPGCTDRQLVETAREILLDQNVIEDGAFYRQLFNKLDPHLKIKVTW